MGGRWFRLYDELVDDPKVQMLSDLHFRALINLWCLASRNGGVLPPINETAFSLRMKPEKASEIFGQLRLAGLIEDDDGGLGVTRPHNWNGRQFKSDVSNERVKRHRERQRIVTGPVTNAVTATPPETETETETETEKKDRSLRSRAARARPKSQIPLGWHPSQASIDRGKALGFSESSIGEIAEDLRVWAEGKGEMRANWDATFDGFVRRDAKVRAANANGKAGAHDRLYAAASDLIDDLSKTPEIENGQFKLLGK